MKKYNTMTINAYIKGNRNSELENDKYFMMAVIEKTKDKKYIEYCSDNVKNDFEFIMFLVNTFNGDVNFITNLYSNYLSYLNNYQFNGIITRNIHDYSIVNDMSMAIKKNNYASYEDFQRFLSVLYYRVRIDIELVNKYDPEPDKYFGMGFFCFSEIFGLNVDILNYMAEKMVKEILFNNSHLFRKHIFDRFQTADKVENLHLICLDFLNDFDKDLVKYLVVEFEVLEKSFNGITYDLLQNWDRYYEEYEVRKYNKLLNRSHRIYSSATQKPCLSEDEILLHIAEKYELIDKIARYNVMSKTDVDNILNSFSDNHLEDLLTYIDSERAIYESIEEEFKKLVSKRKFDYSLIKNKIDSNNIKQN